MPLTEQERRYMEDVLDKCDAGLTDKPMLASVYDARWRADFRARTMSLDSTNDVTYPRAYALPHFDWYYPDDLQARIEEGARLFLPKLPAAERNHMIARLRSDSMSAEEELLLVRGVTARFGEAAIIPPKGRRDQSKPEFTLRLGGIQIDFEAKGLFDSVRIRSLNRAAIESGEYCWVTGDDVGHDMNRLRNAVVQKMKQGRRGVPRIVVLTQYTPWPTVPEAVDLVRRLAMLPGQFNLPTDDHALAVAYVYDLIVQGVWFNQQTADRHSIPRGIVNRLRVAIRESFYPRNDGKFLSEQDDDAERGTNG